MYMVYSEQVTTSVCWPVCQQRGRIRGVSAMLRTSATCRSHLTGYQNLGVFLHGRKLSSFFLLKWSIFIQYSFSSTRRKHSDAQTDGGECSSWRLAMIAMIDDRKMDDRANCFQSIGFHIAHTWQAFIHVICCSS